MMAEPVETREILSDEEVRRRLLTDPELRARAEEILEQAKNGGPVGPGILAEELPDFLRERKRSMDRRPRST
jgi:hypothetical protein